MDKEFSAFEVDLHGLGDGANHGSTSQGHKEETKQPHVTGHNPYVAV